MPKKHNGPFIQNIADNGSLLQPSLKVGEPSDKYEQEADRVADSVMRMPDPHLLRQPIEEEEEEMVQMQAMEEEELQMQPVEEEEEEQLQMQLMEEEEELQILITHTQVTHSRGILHWLLDIENTNTTFSFVRWIDEDLAELARAQVSSVPTLDESRVTGMP